MSDPDDALFHSLSRALNWLLAAAVSSFIGQCIQLASALGAFS